ncbi:MAG: CoB--CoM heterodisulfide reductase [Flavobacteriaceae bacterium]|nr:CoB--CoM heterodisulfide reductase [Flavobacteriaceae bacterium]|tara:strand:+ start:19968 stop:20747 length:780 start_codon:yes stop_codon:yes gene_type:complete
MKIPILSELKLNGKEPEVIFWVGCAGSFDDRAKKVTKSFIKILDNTGVSYAILGNEESCTGDPAKRSGNEFIFQMQAINNIEILNSYNVKKIVTTCPHCFNTLKNEYPNLGGSYQVIHHTEFINTLLSEKRIKINGGSFKGKKITYHDSCYLGRANKIYEAPRDLIKELDLDLVEMKNSRSNGLCCGAGGAQMFKEPEKGDKDVNVLRTEEALDTGSKIIAVACPFCNIMMSDGVKGLDKSKKTIVLDIAELVSQAEEF